MCKYCELLPGCLVLLIFGVGSVWPSWQWWLYCPSSGGHVYWGRCRSLGTWWTHRRCSCLAARSPWTCTHHGRLSGKTKNRKREREKERQGEKKSQFHRLSNLWHREVAHRRHANNVCDNPKNRVWLKSKRYVSNFQMAYLFKSVMPWENYSTWFSNKCFTNDIFPNTQLCLNNSVNFHWYTARRDIT